MKTRKRAAFRLLVAVALVATGLAATASSANAAGGERGQLLIKGPGSLYTGQRADVAESVAAGSTATFMLKIRNTSSTTEQYNFWVGYSDKSCTVASCSVHAVLTTGGVDVTALAAASNYYTEPIAPGGTQIYTLKLTPSTKNSTPGDYFQWIGVLNDTAGYEVSGGVFADLNVIRSTGTSGADQFVSSTGSPATSRAPAVAWTFVSAPSVVVNKTFTYTVKLMNDSPTPSSISYDLQPFDQCSSYFPLRITQGTRNVTLAVVRNQYSTGTLAHGASVTLTITGTYSPGGADCLETNSGEGTEGWESDARDSAGDRTEISLFFSPADAYTPPLP
jgi:hypothetical protein